MRAYTAFYIIQKTLCVKEKNNLILKNIIFYYWLQIETKKFQKLIFKFKRFIICKIPIEFWRTKFKQRFVKSSFEIFKFENQTKPKSITAQQNETEIDQSEASHQYFAALSPAHMRKDGRRAASKAFCDRPQGPPFLFEQKRKKEEAVCFWKSLTSRVDMCSLASVFVERSGPHADLFETLCSWLAHGSNMA